MENIKKNFSLYIGLAIPVIMILLVAGVVYAPRVFNTVPPPQHDFLYAVGDNVVYASFGRDMYPYPAVKGIWPKYVYTVENGKLKRTEAGLPESEMGEVRVEEIVPKFYIHDTQTNVSTQITFEEAEALTLDTGAKSPDGFEIVHGQSGGGGIFPFFYDGNNYNKRYIRKDYFAQELELNLPSEYYAEFFLGWVIK